MFSKSAIKWLQSILGERFNDALMLSCNGRTFTLTLEENDASIIFNQVGNCFEEVCTNLPCTYWRAESEGWQSILGSSLPAPGIKQLPSVLIEQDNKNYVINYDILGLIYWMLTRQEEIGRIDDLDYHKRFPAEASHAYKHGYLERPIVDEWLHILGQVIERIWPQLELRRHQFSMKVSHDVDAPSRYGFCHPKNFIRAVGGDIIKRQDYKGALLAPWIRLKTKQALHPQDPYNTFDWIMDISEQHGLTSAFYFICGGTAREDADYQPGHPAIRDLMRRIHDRGHEIGLHPSYDVYRNPRNIVAEAQRLKSICTEENIEQEKWGGRMHYLRWEQPTTLHGWEQANMSYDSTLSYADRPGFRCGTCFEYPAFDPIRQKILNLRIRPLIAMECSIIAKRYMGLGYSKQALEAFLKLKETCRKVDGQFTLLWHNSHFTNKQDICFYNSLCAE